MENLLSNPAVQAGFLPFGVALLVALAFRPVGYRLGAGLALLAGLLATLWAIQAGFVFPPRASTQKLVLLTLLALPLGLLLHLLPLKPRVSVPLVAVLGMVAALWLVWPVLARAEGAALWLLALGTALYVGWQAAAFDGLEDKPQRVLSSATVLGFGTGGAILFGASAKLAQIGLALGAAAAAVALLYLLLARDGAGRLFTFPLSLLAGLVGVAGLVYAKLPWYALALLAAVPLAAYLPLPEPWNKRVQLVVTGLLALLPAAAAVLLTWQAEGGVPL